MRAAQVEQLDAVLQQPHEPVRAAEVLAVVASDVAVVDQGLAAPSRVAADPQPLVDPAVHQLQQLDGELDVAQPAGAQLDLAVGLAAGISAITRLRIAWVSATKFSRSAARHTIGPTMSHEVLAQRQVAGHRVGP